MSSQRGPDTPNTSPIRRIFQRAGLWGARLRPPLLLLAGVMAAFSLERLLLLLTLRSRFHDVSRGEIFQALGLALRFDLAFALLLIMPLLIVLALVPTGALSRRWFGRLIAAYAGTCMALLLVACIADYFFFREFDLRLNYQVLEYFRYPAVYRAIWQQYPVIWSLLATVVVTLGSCRLFLRWGWSPQPEPAQGWQRLWTVLLVPMAVVGIRGSLGNRAMNSGLVYFCPSPTLAQLSLNGCYTLKEAIVARGRERRLADCYPVFPQQDEALRQARQLLERPQDHFLDDIDNPLRRITQTGRPQQNYNVVLIVLESAAWPYVGALGGDERLMPNLSAIAESGILMDHCFAVGHRTAQGLGGTLAGFPALPGNGVITRPESEGCFLTIGSVLQRRGYDTIFLHPGQSYFDHMKAFCRSNGYSRSVFEHEMPCKTFHTPSGFCDEDAFDSLHEIANQQPADRPWLLTMLTISFHNPYTIPPGKIEPVDPTDPHSEELNACRYTDWAIGKFFEKARHASYFDHTIFVITADHIGNFRQDPPIPGANFRVPFILYAPSILGPPRRVHTVCSQTDIAPTILSLLGGSYEHCFFGSSVLDRPTNCGMALMHAGDDQLFFMDAQCHMLRIPPSSSNVQLYRYTAPARLKARDLADPDASAQARELQNKAIALFQSAEILFRRHSYHLRSASLVVNSR